MAPPLLPIPAPIPRRRGTRSIINYNIMPTKLAEKQKLLEQNKEEFYPRNVNHNEPWFSNTYQGTMEFPLLSGDFSSVPTFGWDWYSNLDYYTGITDTKLEFTASYSQPHSPPVNNTSIASTPSTSSSCSSPQLSPIPKLESPTLSTVELAGTQKINAQAAFSYLPMPTPPDAFISKGISSHQPDQKQFGNPFHHSVQHHSDFTRLLQLDALWAFS
jgi:hypothetical protein